MSSPGLLAATITGSPRIPRKRSDGRRSTTSKNSPEFNMDKPGQRQDTGARATAETSRKGAISSHSRGMRAERKPPETASIAKQLMVFSETSGSDPMEYSEGSSLADRFYHEAAYRQINPSEFLNRWQAARSAIEGSSSHIKSTKIAPFASKANAKNSIDKFDALLEPFSPPYTHSMLAILFHIRTPGLLSPERRRPAERGCGKMEAVLGLVQWHDAASNRSAISGWRYEFNSPHRHAQNWINHIATHATRIEPGPTGTRDLLPKQSWILSVESSNYGLKADASCALSPASAPLQAAEAGR